MMDAVETWEWGDRYFRDMKRANIELQDITPAKLIFYEMSQWRKHHPDKDMDAMTERLIGKKVLSLLLDGKIKVDGNMAKVLSSSLGRDSRSWQADQLIYDDNQKNWGTEKAKNEFIRMLCIG